MTGPAAPGRSGSADATGSDDPGAAGAPERPDVVLVRHGATEWSVSGRHTGRTDLPLLPEGEEQARRAGRQLDGRSFALVLVSPLQRARRTCELAGFGDVAEVDDHLLEWDYGEYEGVTTATIRESVPGWTVWDGPILGGEPIDAVAARADRVIERLRGAGGDCALFGHGHMLRILAARWCGMDPGNGRHLPLSTGTVSELGWEHETPGIRTWNARG